MHHSVYVQLLLTLAASVVLVAVFRRLKLPTILAYLLIGLIIGQMGFEFFAPDSNAHIVAEIGVVFMLFTLGLEFSLPKVISMRTQVLGLGSLQVGLTLGLFYLLSISLALHWTIALVASAALTMSSTAIVTKQLSEQNEFHHRHGTLSIATLLFQDMAAIPLLILVPLLASHGGEDLPVILGLALLKGLFAFLVILAAGKWVLPRLFYEVASSHSDELFVMTSLTVALVASWFTQWLGLSMALGAFMAGMLLAESQFKHQIETEIKPFRDILLGLFFITIGSLINLQILAQYFWLITGLLLAIIVIKFGIVWLICRWLKESTSHGFKTALILSHAGELGFVLVGISSQKGIVDELSASIILSVGVLSMLVSTFLIRNSSSITRKLLPRTLEAKQQSSSKQLISAATKELSQHVVICGFGRNGQSIKRFLDRLSIPSVVLDLDPMRVREATTAGEKVFYGDARRRSILVAAGIESSRLVVVTFDRPSATLDLLSCTRQYFPEIPVVVRTKDDRNLETFLHSGASQVIPESLESSLMLVGQVLYSLGLPLKTILDEIQKVRDDRYHLLQSFFHGSSSDLLRVLQTHHEQLHAVVLSGSAFAIGKPIKDINLPEKISIEAVKRGAESYAPPDRSFELKLGDIVLLSGDPDYIERAENLLVGG
ncbi:MAG: cation:proton antiporter [Gammaproteobacteria bacterium]|nr:cation:proton antiporter [Gammaproteobacteria bacterium]